MRKIRHAVAKIEELTPDTGKTVPLGNGEECTLFLHGDHCYAVGSLCPHQNAPLEGAPAENGCVVCRRHGYRFELKTGDCVTIGGYGIPVYDVQIEAGVVYVSIWDYEE